MDILMKKEGYLNRYFSEKYFADVIRPSFQPRRSQEEVKGFVTELHILILEHKEYLYNSMN